MIGRNERALEKTDVMTILRDCKQQIATKNSISRKDYGFFMDTLRRIVKFHNGKRKRSVVLDLPVLMRLRRIARTK